MTGERMPPFHE